MIVLVKLKIVYKNKKLCKLKICEVFYLIGNFSEFPIK